MHVRCQVKLLFIASTYTKSLWTKTFLSFFIHSLSDLKELFHVIHIWTFLIISVGMVKQPTDHSGSDFLISNEDFPALPGAPAPGVSRLCLSLTSGPSSNPCSVFISVKVGPGERCWRSIRWSWTRQVLVAWVWTKRWPRPLRPGKEYRRVRTVSENKSYWLCLIQYKSHLLKIFGTSVL